MKGGQTGADSVSMSLLGVGTKILAGDFYEGTSRRKGWGLGSYL